MQHIRCVLLVLIVAPLAGMSADGCSATFLGGADRGPPAVSSQPAGGFSVLLRVDLEEYPDADSINWDFGDDSRATNLDADAGQEITHTYASAGLFSVDVFLFNRARERIATGTLAVTVGGQEGTVNESRVAVRLHTNFGDIVLELNPDAAPETVANFLQYVEDGHYDGIVFHRVVEGFVIQGGAFQSLGEGADPRLREIASRDPIGSEALNGLSNIRGTIAMALRGTNANSATDQFYINLGNNTGLDDGNPPFTVFGRVVDGLDVVDDIAAVDTGTFDVETLSSGVVPFDDVPVEDVVIQSATRQ